MGFGREGKVPGVQWRWGAMAAALGLWVLGNGNASNFSVFWGGALASSKPGPLLANTKGHMRPLVPIHKSL